MRDLTVSYSLIQLKNNPIEFAKLILCTCSGFKLRKPNILDIYLILPLLLYEAGTRKLYKARIDSSIQSIYYKDNIAGIAGLQGRLERLKEKTIYSFIIAINMNLIDIEEDTLDIKITKNGEKQVRRFQKENMKCIKEAINLGKILSKSEVKENYRLLGVKRI